MSMETCVDGIAMAYSTKTSIDGLWIGAFYDDNDKEVLNKTCEAVLLIKAHDRLRFERICKDIKRIWVTRLPGAWGVYSAKTDSCRISARFAASAHPIFFASLIVHEAMHARLRQFGYEEGLRHRLETICHHQQFVFAGKHPGGDVVRTWLRDYTPGSPETLTDEARTARHLQGFVAEARELGLPSWLVTLLLRVRSLLELVLEVRKRALRVRRTSWSDGV